MRISIITVSFNSGATIADSIRSVACQAPPDVEHIVIDGKSSDDTLCVVKTHRHQGLILKSESDKGIYDAMNKGLALASCEIVGILNSDDFYTQPDVLKEVVSFFESDPDLEVIMGGVDFVDNADLSRVVRKISSTGFSPWMLRFGFMPPHPAIFIRRSTYNRIGHFNLSYKIAADFEFLIRLFLVAKAKYKTIDRHWVRMRIGGASTSGWGSKKIITQEMLRALRSNGIYSCTPLLFLRFPIKYIKQVLL